MATATFGVADSPPAPAPKALGPALSYADALILGVVEGVTEFLPVSSTGHLILASKVLGLDSDLPLLDAYGHPILVARKGEAAQPLSLKDAVDNYNIIIQGGAILAVLILYWRRVWTVLLGVVGRDPKGLRLFRNLFVAFLPAAVIGLLLKKWINAHLFSPGPVLAALIGGAILMLAVERWRKKSSPGGAAPEGPDLHELSWQQSLLIGCCQVFSLWPGTSRSMMTIVGGYLAGLRPVRAAEFSFLLGLMTLTAASGYETVKHGAELVAGLDLGPMLFGILVAAIAAALAVKGFVHWLTGHGLTPFAWYRLALALGWIVVMGW